MIINERDLVAVSKTVNINLQVPYPDPKLVVECLCNYQYIIDQCRFRMDELLAKSKIHERKPNP